MADGNGGTTVNLDEAAAAAARGGESGGSTQTRESGNGSGAGDGKSENGSGEGTGTEKNGSENGGEGEDSINPATGKPFTADEWRDKFRASASGAQDLLTKNKQFETERDAERAKVAQLEKDMVDLKAIAEGKNPEGLKSHEVQAQLKETSEKLALLTEKGSLDDFEKANPLATGSQRESLKNLARANPTKSLTDLWNENLKAGAEAAAAKVKADDEARKKGASDQGSGTSTREPGGNSNTLKGSKGDTGLTLEEFNALPVAKRGELIKKFGLQ